MSTVFSISGLLIMPLWIGMIFLPRWRWTHRVMQSLWSIVPTALLYSLLVSPRAVELLPTLARPQLPAIAALLGTEAGATIGWIHFLAFDLFVGRWAYLDSRERGVSAWVMGPVLFLVLMFGPLGLTVYLLVREINGKRAPDGVGGRHGAPASVTARSPRSGLVVRAVRAALAVNRPLAVVALAMIPLLLLTLAGVALDPREITGAPAWLKPAKFAISVSIYSFTLLWLLSRVKGSPRLVRLTATSSAVALGVEWIVIALQAGRGVRSHFNVTTPFDSVLVSVMGAFVIVIWAMNVVAAVLLLRQQERDHAFAWALRLGLIASVVGGAMAAPMTFPTADQKARMGRGERVELVGAHAVGVPDGGPGLPVTGWSTEGGDLRVPHFFGLHGLQVLPFVGLLIVRARGLRAVHRVALVWIGGSTYLGLVSVLFWQALRGESVIAPGVQVVSAGAVILILAAAGVAGVLLHARQERARFRLAELTGPGRSGPGVVRGLRPRVQEMSRGR